MGLFHLMSKLFYRAIQCRCMALCKITVESRAHPAFSACYHWSKREGFMCGIATFPPDDHYRVTIAMWGARCPHFHRKKATNKPCDTSSYCTDYSYGFYRLKRSNSRFHSQSRRGLMGETTCLCRNFVSGSGAYAQDRGGV